jgi:hypothetical protein
MLKYLIVALGLAFTVPALAHIDGKFTQGPHGGHIIDAGGGKQHWELVAAGGELTLYVTDKEDKPVDTAGGKAEAQVLVEGKTYAVTLSPAGKNTMKGTGPFSSGRGMRVILKTTGVGGDSFQARLTPLQ